MPYATPAAFVQSFGLQETAQYLADEEGLLTPELLKGAMASEWPDGVTPAEHAAVGAAMARLLRKLENQSNVMDGYLRSAVTLPLPEADANAGTLEECCLALTRCALADDADNATDRMDNCCKDWRAWLRDVATDKAKLAGSDGAAPAPSGGARSGQAASGYAWSAFNPFAQAARTVDRS